MSVRTYADLAAAVWRGPARLGRTRLVTVDGPAGSGKTTFARRLGAVLDRAPVLHLDDLYEGWSGLDDVWPRLERWVLAPLRIGHPAHYRRYDWEANRFADWRQLPVMKALVVEGCGAGQRAADPSTTIQIWVEAPAQLCLARGVQRDGEELRTRWLGWQDQERSHYAREDTRSRADVRVDGAPGVAHDPEREFVSVI